MKNDLNIGDVLTLNKIGVGKIAPVSVVSASDSVVFTSIDMSPIFSETVLMVDSVSMNADTDFTTQNFSTGWTEKDPYQKVELGQNYVILDVDDDVQSEHFYKDFGSDFFDAGFTHRFEFFCHPPFSAICWALTNVTSWSATDGNNKLILSGAGDEKYRYFYLRIDDNNGTQEESVTISGAYPSIFVEITRRNKTDLTITLYSDRNYRTCIGSLTGFVPETVIYQYLSAIKGYADPNVAGDSLTGSGGVRNYQISGDI